MLFPVLMHELPIYRGQNYNIFLDLRNKTISFFPLTFKYPLAAIPVPSKVPPRRANEQESPFKTIFAFHLQIVFYTFAAGIK